MTLHPRLSRAAVELVKRFETFEPRAVPASHGGWTLGYGHTKTARQGAEVGRADAEALLLYDLNAAAELVERCTFAPLTDAQFEALTAFAFNVGPQSFRRSTALARLNAGAHLDAADEIERWRLAELGAGTQVVDALVRRRAAEKAHFLSLPPGASTSASARLRPLSEAALVVEPRSATRTAADSVQARLRELIPDPLPAAEPDPLAEPLEPEPTAEPTPLVTAPVFAPLAAVAPEPASPAAFEPPPPPFANDRGPVLVADPLSEEGLDTPSRARPASPMASEAAATAQVAPARRVPPLRRLISLIVGLIGLLLFAGAAALILHGKPNLFSLAAGAVGAVGIAIGLYALMSPPKP